MNYHFTRPTAAGALVFAMAGALFVPAAACGDGRSSSAARSTGRPNMLRLSWRAAGGEPVDVFTMDGSGGAGGGGPVVVAPMPVRVEAIFDRKLDGAMIEDGSVDPPRPRADPPVTAEFPGKGEDFRLVVTYASNGPSISISAQPSYPSGQRVTLAFDRARVTSQSGDPLDGIAEVTVETQPFSGTARSSTANGHDLSPRSAIVLSFNNHPRVDELPAHVEVRTVEGATLDVSVYPDSLDDTRWYVVPAACLGEWPAGEVLLTVRADAVDLYGQPMAAPVEARFVAAAATGGADGGSPAGDAGAGCDAGL